jgi:Ricin-type beta-trefoil lectin domain
MYKSIKRFAFGGSAVVASVLAIATTSIAANPVETYKNLATGYCLDSNTAGQVYTLGCNGGSFQKWTVIRSGSNRILKNVATGYCLDSNTAGQVYTLGCNGGSFQKWTVIRTVIGKASYITFKNLATGYCLDSNTSRQVYTLGCNGGSFQKWY